MCRPALPNLFACGWHLHQSLIERKRGGNAFVGNAQRWAFRARPEFSRRPADARARRGGVHDADRERLQALSAYTLAPDRAIWARDNRGVMVRVLGQPGDPATHLENRIGEPAANPYLYMASQIYAGLDGIAQKRDPGPSADTPYETQGASRCRRISAKRSRRCAQARSFVKASATPSSIITPTSRKPSSRASTPKPAASERGDVTAWEQNEYFDLF